GVNMRAVYIQQTLGRGEKRKSQWIRIGQVCFLCAHYIQELKGLREVKTGEMNPNKLCPKGWAWLIGDCDFTPDEGDCNDCEEPLAPIMKEAR
ncbi:unnamed protein product, partial [marine sediment metagenome]